METVIPFKIIFLAILGLLTFTANADSSSDPCQRGVPTDLAKLLMQRFPDLRMSKLTDHWLDAISYDRKNGGNGCLSVVISDFNGDKKDDAAILLTNNEKTIIQLVATLQRKNGWDVYNLTTWCKNITHCYVEKLEPGLYTRTLAIDGPVSQPDERESIRSKNTSIVSGTLESSGVAYVFSDGKWLYVWVSD